MIANFLYYYYYKNYPKVSKQYLEKTTTAGVLAFLYCSLSQIQPKSKMLELWIWTLFSVAETVAVLICNL